MLKRHKDLLRVIVTGLRHTLAGHADPSGVWQRGDLDRELERLGVAPNGTITPLDALPYPTENERRTRYVADAQLSPLKPTERVAARSDVIERAAYSWINRLLALRVMEARGLIDETLRNNPDYANLSEALFLLRSQAPERAAGADGGWWAVLDDACIAHAATLPGVFDPRDPSVALRPTTPALLQCIAVVGGVPVGFQAAEAEAAFADPDAIGWAYQFYQQEAKDRLYAKLGRGSKVETRAEIAAATQLFTEPYMVQWLLQNSLGASYHEGYPDSELPTTWQYYEKVPPAEGTKVKSVEALSTLTVMDPCMGSGHFLREAFDMLVAMYHEQQPNISASVIADRILRDHLFGVDIDPRAAQLAALTLYLRAWQLVCEEYVALRIRGTPTYWPPTMNLATTPTGLTPGALERHLQRHPEDRVFLPLIEGVFTSLERSDVLGSLVRPSAQLDAAVAKLQVTHTIPMDFNADEAELRRVITQMAGHDAITLKQILLDRVATSIRREVGSSDVAADLFGREGDRGVRLIMLLDRRYAIVATNPPYLGSGNMGAVLKRFVESQYPLGKADLYACFVLRCLQFAGISGRVAMITQQSWLFLSTFAHMRAVPEDRVSPAGKSVGNTGVLREVCIETLAHLGAGAFDEISGEVVQCAMFVLRNRRPTSSDRIRAFRLVGPRGAMYKAKLLRQAIARQAPAVVSMPLQSRLLALPQTPLSYWLTDHFLIMFLTNRPLGDIVNVRHGLSTCDNPRFVRGVWEVPVNFKEWPTIAKGGTYQKWSGLEQWVVNWQHGGVAIKETIRNKYPYLKGNIGLVIGSEEYYFSHGWTYSTVCGGSLGVRELRADAIASHTGYGIFPFMAESLSLVLNSRLASYLLRSLTPKMIFEGGQIASLPLLLSGRTLPAAPVDSLTCVEMKSFLIAQDPTEREFSIARLSGAGRSGPSDRSVDAVATTLHTVEGWIEAKVEQAYALGAPERDAVTAETGCPTGLYPLISGYDDLSVLGYGFINGPPPSALIDFLVSHKRIYPTSGEQKRIKDRLRLHYLNGSGALKQEVDEVETSHDGIESAEELLGASIPVPTETLIEELSAKMGIHPISAYWLISELRAEGVRCQPEERRLLEDRLSVLILRLLGHRWPLQFKSGEPVPEWADQDGILSITPAVGDRTVADTIRERLRAEDGDVAAQQTVALLQELVGVTLEEWLLRQFFPRHVRQFKYRPIVWYLATSPQGGGTKRRASQRNPAFNCLVYYHACAGDLLARLRSQYLQPLILTERRQADEARKTGNETDAVQSADRVSELENFAARLRAVDEEGFACPELDQLLAIEPLDRWSGDGFRPPTSREDLLRRERAWQVDLNDGVRVNIAPLQLAGVLASDVLKVADAKKAIADRARWRAEERRWVREGKLPRCGWMGEEVPESARWTELAPIREAERQKVDDKRQATATLSSPVDRLL